MNAIVWVPNVGDKFLHHGVELVVTKRVNHSEHGKCLMCQHGRLHPLGECRPTEDDRAAVMAFYPQPVAPKPAATPFPSQVFAPQIVDGLEVLTLDDIALATHTVVIGDTGSGKSELVKHLAAKYFPDSQIRVYDTDCTPEDWQGLKVFGRCGKVREIIAAMDSDLKTLDTRTELRGTGKDVGGEIVLIVEEFPALVGQIQTVVDDDYDQLLDNLEQGERKPRKPRNIAPDWIKSLFRRGRKYRLKVIGVGQGFEVEAWKLNGEGTVRDSCDVLYLGGMAYGQLSAIRDKSHRAALKAWLDNCDRIVTTDKATGKPRQIMLGGIVLAKGERKPIILPDLSKR